MNRVRPVTVLLLALILVLGYSLVIRQRRESRLRAALSLYKHRATGEIAELMGRSVGLDWPDGTVLGEAIELIRDSVPASWGFPKGIPVLVDPDGLREAGQSLRSPVKAPPPDDPNAGLLSLGQKLRIVLEPLGLTYVVKDGAIVIISRARAEGSAPVTDEDRQP